jgi:hypothetical protein
MGRIVGLVVVAVASNMAVTGCTGGCYDEADAVRSDPNTECLTLYGGQSPTDPTVCAVPELGGVNGCSEPLTLPARVTGGEPLVVQPGAKIAYPLPDQSVPPAITVVDRSGGARDYVIVAALGDQSVTLTIPVHED